MRQLIYVSNSTLGSDEADLTSILETARTYNGSKGITGLLLFKDRMFLQVLEGASEEIEELMHRIRKDERHSNVIVIEDEMKGGRNFSDWSMALINLDGNNFDHCKEFREWETVQSNSLKQLDDTSYVKDVVSFFCDHL